MNPRMRGAMAKQINKKAQQSQDNSGPHKTNQTQTRKKKS